MVKRKSRVPKDETKRDKFKRIVEPRVRKALKSVRLIGNCATSSYEYTEKDVANIITSLTQECENLEARYMSKGVHVIEFDFE